MNAKQDMEYAPSWQNRDESVLPIADQMRGITVTKGDRVLGYGIVQTTRGRIPQIGFANDVWNTEIPFLLLERLGAVLKEGSEIAIINVDENAPNTIKLFQDAGFEELVRQYEMKKNLT